MKIFISHDMNGLSDDEVKNIRSKAEEYLKERFGDNIEIIDNYTHLDAPENAGRLWHLGRSIQQMQDADIVVFIDDGVESAKGCIIEKLICIKKIKWLELIKLILKHIINTKKYAIGVKI